MRQRTDRVAVTGPDPPLLCDGRHVVSMTGISIGLQGSDGMSVARPGEVRTTALSADSLLRQLLSTWFSTFQKAAVMQFCGRCQASVVITLTALWSAVLSGCHSCACSAHSAF